MFWGVAESNHLVNIINQIDTTYDFDMETRFGQPMVSASYLFDASSLTVMYLPFFRPRNYPSPDGRIRTSLPVVDDEIYLAGASETSNDIAVRWSTIIDNLDLNLFGFMASTARRLWCQMLILLRWCPSTPKPTSLV